MALIEIDHVSKTYGTRDGGVVANDDVTLHVEEGSVFGLFGHNGAGKTTLVNQLLGLLRPDAGSIVVAGEDIVRNRKRGRYLCSAQPQASVPLGELTPRAITSLMARMRGAGDEEITRRVGELFEQLDIAEWADQPGNKLSGGVLRLTCFCMAAIRPGRVVVLDEPTNDVDPVRRRYLWGAIRELTGDGTAVLLVTHNIGEAEGAVDEMAILDHGRVLARGNASRIKASTVGDDMKLQAFTTAPPEAFGHPGWAGNIEVRNGEVVVSFPRDRAVDALTWAAELRGRRLVSDYSLREMSLEDTYVQLVGDRDVGTDAH